MITFKTYLSTKYTKGTIENYLLIVDHFCAQRRDAETLKYADIVRHIESLVQRGLSEKTRVIHLAALKQYYDYLIHIGVRNDHPCNTLTIKSKNNAIQTQELFSSEELALLLSRPNKYPNLSSRNKAIISLLIYQGLRSDEITRLNVPNIDLDEGVVFVKASKHCRRRTLSLYRTQFSIFYEYLNTARRHLMKERNNHLFLTQEGKPITVSAIYTMIEPLKGLFPGRTLSPLKIRQSVISNWLNERKFPLEDVQDMAGHKFPSTTEKYKSIDIEEKRKWINRYHPLA